jgi:hypothetical protein
MATTYNADNYGVPMPSCPFVGVVLRRDFLFTVAVALVINDVIQCCKIPGAGAPLILDNFFIDVADLDTGAGACQLSVGDGGSPARFVAAQNTVGANAGKLTAQGNGVNASLPVQYAINENFVIKCTVAPSTGATAVVIKGFIEYHLVGQPSPIPLSA